MLKPNQIAAMLELQSSMNAKINPEWFNAGYPFLRAVVIEGAEAMEHHGWKWWKAQSIDLPQLQMELVDIWHFALSHFIVSAEGDLDKAGALIQINTLSSELIKFDGQLFELSVMDTVSKLELLIGMATMRKFSVRLFASLLTDCSMTWDDLNRHYISKNVLNFFRQDNGYKDGTYVKMWHGREDNEHLVEIALSIDSTCEDFQKQLYAGLGKRYAMVIG